MHEPLLVPDRLQRARRDFRQDCNGVRRAERPEAILGRGTVVGITGVEGNAEPKHDQAGIEVRLKQDIDMDIGGKIPARLDEVPHPLELHGLLRHHAVLAREPIGILGQIVGAGAQRTELLGDFLHAKFSRLPKKLRDIGADQVACREAAEENVRGYDAAGFGPAEIRKARQLRGRGAGGAVRRILGEGDVTCQCHPVEFDHFTGRLRRAERRRRGNQELVRVGAFQIKRQAGLRIDQLALTRRDIAAKLDSLKISRPSG